ncbi:MAG: hypothetical protein AMXMBFR57_16900 [Acidimicrobiia bacterium]
MSIRLGVDLDGTLADLSSVYRDYERRLFGELAATPDERATEVSEKGRLKAARVAVRRRQAVWEAIRRTPDFWTLLPPIEGAAIAQLHEAATTKDWEVYFTTQRPATVGRSVQAQTRDWLATQGFPGACVLALNRSRGRLAAALDLDYLIDDLAQNCVDALSDSRCRPLLMVRSDDAEAKQAAARLQITVVRSMADALTVISRAGGEAPTPWRRLLRAVTGR